MPLAPALQEMIDGQEIELLHMDAQGAELGFLRYAKRARLNEKMHFLAVSTHHSTISDSATTHTNCLAELMRQGGTILRKRIVEESFSGDATGPRREYHQRQFVVITRSVSVVLPVASVGSLIRSGSVL